jgi:aminoglycoside phosphotransferase (APT) family kinase protein
MQDLGWLCVKTWRFGGRGPVGGIGQREDLFASYERASGMVVDPVHVRFWEGWGCIKWAIICLMKGQSQRSVEAFAIGRRMEEPLYDFLEFIDGSS